MDVKDKSKASGESTFSRYGPITEQKKEGSDKRTTAPKAGAGSYRYGSSEDR